jgi:Icc-related predicted phosphoesterase
MPNTLRVAALADLHYSRTSQGSLLPLLAPIGEQADVLLVCGDLTHLGLPEEASALVKELNTLRLPIVSVLGNHDHHAGRGAEIQRILTDAGIRVLDGDTFEHGGVGFAGVKGFAGGFGQRVLEAWGEEVVKLFVREAVEETLRLESALARLQRMPRVALLHYSPIADTVEGEPLEIYPFLGSSRLEEPLNRYQVTVAFHGHAHHGRPEGRTSTGIAVYNVSMPLLRSQRPDAPPYRIVEVPVPPPEST